LLQSQGDKLAEVPLFLWDWIPQICYSLIVERLICVCGVLCCSCAALLGSSIFSWFPWPKNIQ
jgi:hypothetical protein